MFLQTVSILFLSAVLFGCLEGKVKLSLSLLRLIVVLEWGGWDQISVGGREA